MRGLVYNNGVLAGFLQKEKNGAFLFTYEDSYFTNADYPSISLTLPKNRKEHSSENLFPFFYGLLSEGINKDIQCRLYKIDENDDFTRLLLTAGNDTIGAITVKPEDNEMFRML
jgi:HipA-like protein